MKATLPHSNLNAAHAPAKFRGSCGNQPQLEAGFDAAQEPPCYLPEPMVYGNSSSYLTSDRLSVFTLSNPVTIQFVYYFAGTPVPAGGHGFFEIQNDNSNFIKADVNGVGDLIVQTKIGTGTYLSFPAFFTAAGIYVVLIEWTGADLTASRNGVVVDTQTANNLNLISSNAAIIYFMKAIGGSNALIIGYGLSSLRYTTGGLEPARYPICEDSGVGGSNLAYDVSGNARHLSGSASYSACPWNRTNDEDPHMALYGYRQNGAIYVPALLDLSACADGNPITNPPPNEFTC